MSSAKIGQVINLEDIQMRRKVRNQVHRIGVELEGGWDSLPTGVRLVSDGSVRFNEPSFVPPEGYRRVTDWQDNVSFMNAQGDVIRPPVTNYTPPRHVGELPSSPMPPDALDAWMRTFYPHHVNESCGMHLHMSFQSALTYQRLMDVNFPATVLAYMGKWGLTRGLPSTHALFARINGSNSYCRNEFHADAQSRATRKGGDRYTVINYCYGLHQTLECRLLPMMDDVEMAIAALRELILITNTYLLAARKREEKIKATYAAEGAAIPEDIRICV